MFFKNGVKFKEQCLVNCSSEISINILFSYINNLFGVVFCSSKEVWDTYCVFMGFITIEVIQEILEVDFICQLEIGVSSSLLQTLVLWFYWTNNFEMSCPKKLFVKDRKRNFLQNFWSSHHPIKESLTVYFSLI